MYDTSFFCVVVEKVFWLTSEINFSFLQGRRKTSIFQPRTPLANFWGQVEVWVNVVRIIASLQLHWHACHFWQKIRTKYCIYFPTISRNLLVMSRVIIKLATCKLYLPCILSLFLSIFSLHFRDSCHSWVCLNSHCVCLWGGGGLSPQESIRELLRILDAGSLKEILKCDLVLLFFTTCFFSTNSIDQRLGLKMQNDFWVESSCRKDIVMPAVMW